MIIYNTKDRAALLKAKSTQTGLDKLRILAVGPVSQWQGSGRSLSAHSQIGYADFEDVTFELLDMMRPDVVMSPVLCPQFDCLDLAQVLDGCGFTGRYRVFGNDLPAPEIIRREIMGHYPGLDFGLMTSNRGLNGMH